MLKRIVGKGHAEFATNKQQVRVNDLVLSVAKMHELYFLPYFIFMFFCIADFLLQDALEYLQHFLTVLERNAKTSALPDVAQLFKFEVEERLQCSASNQVRYKSRTDSSILVPVDLMLATNNDEVAAYKARVAEQEAIAMSTGAKVLSRSVGEFSSFFSSFRPSLLSSPKSISMRRSSSDSASMSVILL
jgi:ubiquitin carboxyl-terminal hydrolase 5/13